MRMSPEIGWACVTSSKRSVSSSRPLAVPCRPLPGADLLRGPSGRVAVLGRPARL